jgi:hypothetical protein
MLTAVGLLGEPGAVAVPPGLRKILLETATNGDFDRSM